MSERLYVIYHGAEDNPTLVYVGKTVLTVKERFKRHLRAARSPLHTKELYEHMRHVGIDAFKVLELDNANGETESHYVELLTKQGHKLLNSNRGNTVVAKRPNNAFALLNREANERIERKERLYNEAQQYSKSEVVRQRITGEYPTLEELLRAAWAPCPPELLGADVGRTAERAEYTKLGDISVSVAYKSKDRLMSVLARHRDGRECRLPKPLWYGPNAKRETLLRNLVAEMNSPYGGFEKVYSAAA